MRSFWRGYRQGIKEGLAWSLCWYFYGAGHLAYLLLCAIETEWWADVWYPVYNENIIVSHDLQLWADAEGDWWPWKSPPP